MFEELLVDYLIVIGCYFLLVFLLLAGAYTIWYRRQGEDDA